MGEMPPCLRSAFAVLHLGCANVYVRASSLAPVFSDWWLRHLLWNCPSMNVTGLHRWSVNIGSGNGLVQSGNKPLPEPMYLTGGVPLPRVTFWAQIPLGVFLASIFLPKSLAKGIFFTKNPKNWHFGAEIVSVFGKFRLKREYLGWNSLKSCKSRLIFRKSSLAKRMFSTKISLAKGCIQSKTGAAHPCQKFFGLQSPGLI